MRKIMRYLPILVALAVLPHLAVAQPLEMDTDRMGSDYTSVTLPPGSQPQGCQALCNADPACKAWTFVKPGVQAQNPRCWLKSAVPAAAANSCCVSGVKAPEAAAFEPDTDRPGGDYVDFNVPANWTPDTCQALCKANGQCKAWTYVKPGVQGPLPRCWMKSSVPPKVASNCCHSGVKQ